MNLKEDISKIIEGEVSDTPETLVEYSHDTSLFEVKPEVVVFPKHVDDVKKIVSFVASKKVTNPHISITGRSAGSDMTGGPLNESIILSCTRHLNHFDLNVKDERVLAEPGVFYRDLEVKMKPHGLIFPSYPASKSLCAIGGMVMNNAGGELTLRYGQTRDFVKEVSMVLADGNEYVFKPLSKKELDVKMAQDTFEGKIYRDTFALVENNVETIEKAKPESVKNSSGYALWRIWDKKTFDLSQLFVGSQGTLGVMTKATLKLQKEKIHHGLIAVFFKDWNQLPDVVNAILPHDPESLEVFDDETLKLGIRFMPEIAKKAEQNLFSFALRFLPEAFLGLRMRRLPKLVMLIEVGENNKDLVGERLSKISNELSRFNVFFRTAKSKEDADKYWIMRRESFALLRKHVRGKRTAPFIDDFGIAPKHIPEFLPQLLAILKQHGIKANIAGHAGNGNFHIIPLMDLSKPEERAKIPIVSDKVYDLIIKYNGTITAEHNDGIIRTPYVRKMYGEKMYALFEDIKHIFDPLNIFNPGKKVGGTVEYMKEHIINHM